ncbi:MAG: FAD:protein FMN transferase, partial [Planctomycetota bacterium]
MGTRCRIVVVASDEPAAAEAVAAAFARIAEIEAVLSDYRPNSEAMLLMQKPPGEWHAASADLATVLRLSREVYDATDG